MGGTGQVRKYKQGLIVLIVIFILAPLITATGNETVSTVSVWGSLLALTYGLFLIFFFTIQQRSKLGIQEKVITTKTNTVYECGHCKSQYFNSLRCPQCGSPYRRVLDEKTEEETVEKWKT